MHGGLALRPPPAVGDRRGQRVRVLRLEVLLARPHADRQSRELPESCGLLLLPHVFSRVAPFFGCVAFHHRSIIGIPNFAMHHHDLHRIAPIAHAAGGGDCVRLRKVLVCSIGG